MGSRFDHVRRQQHHSRTAAMHEAGVNSEDYWDYKPTQRVHTVDGPGVVTAVHDGPFPGAEEYHVTLDGGLGGGAYTASQLQTAPTVTGSLEQTAAADYPELAQILAERPDPARIHAIAARQEHKDDGEFYDPACAYPHEGPCPEWGQQHTATLRTTAMPAKSGRPTKGDFTYDVGHVSGGLQLNGYINGEHAGYIQHSAYHEHEYSPDAKDAQAVKVHMLHTSPDHRGSGVASAMMDSLYHHYPKAWINHGFRTDDGSKWWNGYDEPDASRNVHNTAPDEPHPKLDSHWTSHFDVDDVVSDMSSTSQTNREQGHEGNEHRQWDHTEYGGHRGDCYDCDEDGDHRCKECGNYYPHHQEGEHRCCEDCDSDMEHQCEHCRGYVKHSEAETHEQECESNPENDKRKCDDCDEDGEHRCPHCKDYYDHDDFAEHTKTCTDNPANRCADCDSDGEHQCGRCGEDVPHGMLQDHELAHQHGVTQTRTQGLHRGFSLQLNQNDHDVLHNEHIPASARAQHLVDKVIGRDSMPQRHWSTRPEIADRQAPHTLSGARANYPASTPGMGTIGNTQVKLHAHPLTGAEQHTDTGHYSAEADNMGEAHFRGSSHQPMRLSGVSWRKDNGDAWTHHDFPGQGLPVSMPSPGHRNEPGPDLSDGRAERKEQQQAGGAGQQMKLFTSLVTTAALDADFRFHVTAAWRDVVSKAKRIRTEGGVRVTMATDGVIFGEVQGDHHVYETGLQRLPGRTAVASWNCGCKWAAYHWGADDDLSRFAGRMCSHALALQYEAQSRGMFGRNVSVDEERAAWTPRHVVVRYDIDSGKNQLQLSSALHTTAAAPGDAPIRRVASALAAAGMDRAEILVALAAAGIHPGQEQLFDAAPYKVEKPKPVPDREQFGDDENGHRYHVNSKGERFYPCFNKHCPEGGKHEDGESAEAHHDVYTDWNAVHPTLPDTLHRGMALDLPDAVHSVVHDEHRPTAERAHALAEHLKGEGMGTHWTPDHDQAKHYSGITDGRDRDTHVILHAHTPSKRAIETDPDTLAEQDVIAMGSHDDAEVPLRHGAKVSLKGISWRQRTGEWTRHDFDKPVQHHASVDAPFGEPSGTVTQLPKAPGATSPRRGWENPASAGPLASADPVGWNRQLPLESFASLDDPWLLDSGEGAEAALHDEPEGALPATDGVQIPSNDEALTPSMTAGLKRQALKDFSHAERQELINEGEGVRAANLDRLQIEGTHYEDLEHVLKTEEDDTTWLI